MGGVLEEHHPWFDPETGEVWGFLRFKDPEGANAALLFNTVEDVDAPNLRLQPWPDADVQRRVEGINYEALG